ncbi:monosaccharide ABC transporter ATP-binding protein (CUT2 family) [Muricomes intestini]|uniref:Monosaccharide ABC transporter ATP-binding protein (CUT2 family) n=1 Tax=Muricomes intestini TaxID=1796634 RepID=A0A4R3JWT0_9FIRM|nr:sugar ABC transporter ATP-binding protein [Muricomes intestini]TCS72873.1 monosaccharide ABC transporter ATP-binding protein (CUT2 family) [Muricomes intestini]
MAEDIVLEFRNVSKKFGSVKALDNISFGVQRGEVHCLVGENGAGKSTLMKILSGAYDITSGKIFMDGKETRITNPSEASRLGVTVVYQEMNTVDKLSIVDNIVLGMENAKLGFNLKKENIKFVKPYLERVGLSVNPDTVMGTLSIAQKQMVMIAKALAQKVKVLVLDEPTAMLNENEVRILFDIIASLKKDGITIIYISHRMEEIYEIGDRITVLKDGTYVGTFERDSISMDQLIVKMVGRELSAVYPDRKRERKGALLKVKDLNNQNVSDISFTLYQGEVLGVAGLVGSGRSEMLRAIFGADAKMSGEVYMKGQKVDINSPRDSIKKGIGFVPEDRKTQGIIRCLSVKENLTLIYSQLNANHGFLKKKKENKVTRDYINRMNIKTPNKEQLVGRLSGGNSQKVVIAKWLSIAPDILLLDEPTQGIDVGAKAEIYQLIDQLAREGIGVIVVSSDLMEIINLSNRILVMKDGSIAGELSGDHITEDQVMLYAMGVESNEAS